MLRRLHSLAGLTLALLIVVIASTGALLSLEPAVDRVSYRPIAPGTSVAALADSVAARHVKVDTIRVRGDGAVTVKYNDGGGRQTETVDPATGAGLGPYQSSAVFRFLTNLHRSLFLGDGGRIMVALTALGLLAACVSGTVLLARNHGGYRALLKPIRGSAVQRWHGELGRLALAGLLLSSLTGALLAGTTFGVLPLDETSAPSVDASGGKPAPIRTLQGLADIDMTRLMLLTFPSSDDSTASFVARTNEGESLIDPATGKVISTQTASFTERLGDLAFTLHTGRGAWAFALLLGLSGAAAPALGVTGFWIWCKRRIARPRVKQNAQAGVADTVILVGSEGNSTWGFAATLHAALTGLGRRVHTATMNEIGPQHLNADHLLILTATHGDGDAPASAKLFLDRIGTLDRRIPVAVLGFGDRTFPHFCGYAHRVAETLAAKGWPQLTAFKRIDRRSAQEFAQWGDDLGAALGRTLKLEHIAVRPKTVAWTLIGRELYGEAVGAPVAVLRFDAAKDARTGKRGRLPTFEAGDLVGVLAPGSDMPRFYSLASSTCDGVMEICVRLQPGGLCSTYLHGLRVGDRIEAFIRENPTFRPAEGRAPLILIGAGAGIAPLAGFVRNNRLGRPVHLYWGGRSPSSDFLYQHELAEQLAQKRLTTLNTAFSRLPRDGAYVQDRIADDAHRLRGLIRQEAQILLCGGRDMARAVRDTLDVVVRPLGLDLDTLRSNGKYLEDVY